MSASTTDTGESALVSVPRRCAANVVASFRRLGRPIDWRKAFPFVKNPTPVLIGLAVVLGAALVVMAFVDAPVTRAVQRLPVWLLDFANFITDFGKGAWVLWPLGLLYLLLAALPLPATRMSQKVYATIMVRAGFLFASIGLTGLSVSLVKNMIGRARPGVGGSINPFLFEPFHWAPAYASFPSGHGTTVFAVLAAFGTLFPRARTALIIYAIIIAISRVVLRAHYVSDVMVSAAFGIVGVILVRRWFAALHLGFSLAPDGRLVQHPGPSVRRIKAVARDLLT
ncbi:MAG TPA: phosphatase PAP2 family protein [Pseudolabrys sp.]|nr:phosphatase PAP2 family protein [Pseudolabrys sp.]